MLLLAELRGSLSLWLHIAGGLLLIARLSHAFGFPRPAPNAFRFFGTAATRVIHRRALRMDPLASPRPLTRERKQAFLPTLGKDACYMHSYRR
jgi:hypothetical protein